MSGLVMPVEQRVGLRIGSASRVCILSAEARRGVKRRAADDYEPNGEGTWEVRDETLGLGEYGKKAADLSHLRPPPIFRRPTHQTI